MSTLQKAALLKNPLLSLQKVGLATLISLTFVFFGFLTLDSNIMRVNVEKNPRGYIVNSEELFAPKASIKEAIAPSIFGISLASFIPDDDASGSLKSSPEVKGSTSVSSEPKTTAQIELFFRNAFSFVGNIVDTHLSELIAFIVAGMGFLITGLFEVIKTALFNGGKALLVGIKNLFFVWPLQVFQALFMKYFSFRYNRRVFLDEESFFLKAILCFITLFRAKNIALYLNRQITLLEGNSQEFEKVHDEMLTEKQQILNETKGEMEIIKE